MSEMSCYKDEAAKLQEKLYRGGRWSIRAAMGQMTLRCFFLKIQDKGLSSGMSRPVPGFRPNEKRSDCVKELFNAGCTNMKIGV